MRLSGILTAEWEVELDADDRMRILDTLEVDTMDEAIPLLEDRHEERTAELLDREVDTKAVSADVELLDEESDP